MMTYHANIKNLQNETIQVYIYMPKLGAGDVEITLSDNPIIITQNSDGLFSPIKSCSCTLNIMTDGGLWDLYTIDPQEIMVTVYNLTTQKMLFQGYATPCQYGQDWTTIDVLSLECVDMLSSLKNKPYKQYLQVPGYIAIDQIISYCIAMSIGDYYDQLYHQLSWYWPDFNFKKANGYTFLSSSDMLSKVKLNEANFYDDDDEHTPWTCYEVLEEICKFFCVSAVPYQGSTYFIDYLAAAATGSGGGYNLGNYNFFQYSLDMDVDPIAKSKSLTIQKSEYAGGTMEVGTDDLYNIINVNSNRYDLDEIVTDLYDHDYHNNITKYYNFGNNSQLWTITETNFWGTQHIIEQSYVFKQYCTLLNKSNWKHRFWLPRSMNEFIYGGEIYSSAMNGYSQFINVPENKYINTISACILHYASFDAFGQKPSKLDWKKVIMFNCLTDTIKPESTNTMGKLKATDVCTYRNPNNLNEWITGTTFEVPVLEYTMPYEMNFSPKNGKSWIVINGKLWYQQRISKTSGDNYHGGNPNSGSNPMGPSWEHNFLVTNLKEKKQVMFPTEDVTDISGYWAQYNSELNGAPYAGHWFRRTLGTNVKGWNLMKFKVQCGDKYWNGSQWTTTDSGFYMAFTGDIKDSDGNSTDSFAYMKWMNIITNTDYEDKVGTDGYAIPIEASDAIKGQLKITLYTPRQFPTNYDLTTASNVELEWFERAPVVFMKDFKVEYVYTDSSEWWLDNDTDKEDIRYSNSTKDEYKYEKDIEMKINSWQQDKPIAKSFPIIDFESGNLDVCEFLKSVGDPSNYPQYEYPQELNVIERQIRHYAEPRKTAKIYRHQPMNPWARAIFNDAAELDGVFVVDKQEFNVKECNCTVELVEYGDATINAGSGME